MMKPLDWNPLIQQYRQQLDDRKIQAGEVVPFSFSTPLQTVLMLMAIWERKATAFPICYSLTEDEKAELLTRCSEKIFTDSQPHPKSEGIFNFRQHIFDMPKGEEDALWVATSGSSGTPKVVRLSFDNLYYSALGSIEFYSMKEEQTSLISIPLHHVGGVMILVRSLLSQGKLMVPHHERELCQFFNCC